MMTSVWRLRLRGRQFRWAERRSAWGARGVAGIGAGALFGALCAFCPASAQQTPPPGMVPYDHPVYHNGVRVLWHGVWRGKGKKSSDSKDKGDDSAASAPDDKAAADEAKPAGDDAKPAAEAATQASARDSGLPTKLPPYVASSHQTAKAPVAVAAKTPPAATPDGALPMREFSILADADDACAMRMAGEFVSALTARGAPGHAVVGRTSVAGLAKAINDDTADFAIVPLDGLMAAGAGDLAWRDRAPYVIRLSAETIEVIAPQTVAQVSALTGQSVSYGVAESATAASAKLLFSRLGIAPKPTYEPLGEALAQLQAGKRDAVVVLGAKSAPALADFGKDGRFHVLSIPWSPALKPLYEPARVTSADRPRFVAASERVDTIGVPMALIALDAERGSPRADLFGRQSRVFLDGYDDLLREDRDAHWRSVNLAAPVPGWPRLAGAQDWVNAKRVAADASLDTFRAAARNADAPTAEDSDRLYESLMRWRDAAQ